MIDNKLQNLVDLNLELIKNGVEFGFEGFLFLEVGGFQKKGGFGKKFGKPFKVNLSYFAELGAKFVNQDFFVG